MTASRFTPIFLRISLLVGMTFGCSPAGHSNQPPANAQSGESAQTPALASDSHPTGLPKLRIRTAGPNAFRLIEDVNGNPFFMAGRCPQNIVRAMPTADMNAYFKAMHDKGFNTAWVLVTGFDNNQQDGPTEDPHDYAGNAVKNNPDDINYCDVNNSNLNMKFVASVDAMVNAATNNGIYLFLNPMNQPGNEEIYWGKHTPADAYNWGKFWGARYASFSNVNIMLGNDGMPLRQANAMVKGLKEGGMADRLYCVDVGSASSPGLKPSLWVRYAQGATWINLWGWYTYEWPASTPDHWTYQYSTWSMYTQAAKWGVRNAPTFLVETAYSLYPNAIEGNGVPPGMATNDEHVMRRQLWAVTLGGGTGYGILGNEPDWRAPSLQTLQDPTVTYAGYCKSFFTSRRWDLLVPDYDHTFLTSQATDPTVHDPTYVSAALTLDGKFGAVYYPGVPGNTPNLTLNLSRMAGTSNVYWFDPTNNTTTAIPGSPFPNSGSQTFTTPGKNSVGNTDWVLVVETGGSK